MASQAMISEELTDGLDLIDPSRNFFNPRTAFQPDVQGKLPGVDQREEILTEPGN